LEVVAPNQAPDGDNVVIQLDEESLTEEQRALFFTDLPATLSAPTANDNNSSPILVRLLFPSVAGTVIRSDFLSCRLTGSPFIYAVRSFLSPLQAVTPTAIPDQDAQPRNSSSLLDLLNTSIGGIIGHPAAASQSPPPVPSEDTNLPLTTATLSTALTNDLTYRLSIPWTIPPNTPHPPVRRRIFWIQGRAHITASLQFYAAARAMGIALVVCDVPGHWMESDDPAQNPWAHYREAFVPMNIDADDGLVDRIVNAVRAYPEPVHGVVSISDVRLAPVARACEILGLPTERSEAYFVAGDKARTRRLEEEGLGIRDEEKSYFLEDAGQLEAFLEENKGKIKFPRIVKPCTGWNSDCVAKVRNEEELRAAVIRAAERHARSAKKDTSVIIEPYVPGPEVDANFVILDGQPLFCDITDDFPCPGDFVPDQAAGEEGKKATLAANFMETLMDVPTALPPDEQRVMREALCRSIARAGFKSGIFHCEARVKNSRMEYRPRGENGLMDLLDQEKPLEGLTPSCYLHEINARTPGYINCVAAHLAHGVDYYAIRLLLALGEEGKERIRALAQSFAGSKPPYTLGIAVLPPKRAGIMASEDAVGEFLTANPDLAKHVVFYQTVKQRGEVVQGPDSAELWCVGYAIVASRKGRKECLELAEEARRRFDYKLMEDLQ
jgi:hypothetical protein